MKVEQPGQAQYQPDLTLRNTCAVPGEKEAMSLEIMKADMVHELRHRDGIKKLFVIVVMLLVISSLVWAMGSDAKGRQDPIAPSKPMISSPVE